MPPRNFPNVNILDSINKTAHKLPSKIAYEYSIRNKILLEKGLTISPNLISSEVNVLETFKQDSDIKILPTDKGNAIGIIDSIQ